MVRVIDWLLASCGNWWNVSWVTGTRVLDRQVICITNTAGIGGGVLERSLAEVVRFWLDYPALAA
jgi:hypothetical protein